MQNAHEFASKIPLAAAAAVIAAKEVTPLSEQTNKGSSAGSSEEEAHGRTSGGGANASSTGTFSNGYANQFVTTDGLQTPTTVKTPTPSSSMSPQPGTQRPHPNRSSMPLPAPNPLLDDIHGHSPSHARHTSLATNRPAPPSPSVSRRASAAPSCSSRHSTATSSRPLSRTASGRRQSTQSTQTETQQATSPVKKRTSLIVRIRDFAFPASDVRHTGLGPDVPRSNRHHPHASTASTSSESSSRPSSGWGTWKWAGSKLWGGFGLSGVPSNSRNSASGDDNFPTKSDFDRNFEVSASGDYDDYANSGEHAYADDDDVYSQEDDAGYPDPDIPLVSGLYRALYAFEPEGTAEMRLVEGQIVRIVGRGGGVGWAIAVREGDDVGESANLGVEDGLEKHALVPESYLELVKADEDEET